jgi:hypothetical protein
MDEALTPNDFMHLHVLKGLMCLAQIPHHPLAMARDFGNESHGHESRTYERYGHRHSASFAKHQVW